MRFVFILLALALLVSPANAGEERSYSGGRFMQDIAGHNEGLVKPFNGSGATGPQVNTTTKIAPVAAKTVKPAVTPAPVVKKTEEKEAQKD